MRAFPLRLLPLSLTLATWSVIPGCADVTALDHSDGVIVDTSDASGSPPAPPQPEPPDEEVAATNAVGRLLGSDGDERFDLELREVKVEAALQADMAALTIEHTFYNQRDAQLEATFRFPVPAGAIVTGLALEIDGKMMEGEIVEKRKAERVYQRIVDRMQDPALLRWQGGGTLELRVFPVLPHQGRRVQLRLLAPTSIRSGRALLRLAAGRAGNGPTVQRLSVTAAAASVVDMRHVDAGATTVVDLGPAAAAPRNDTAVAWVQGPDSDGERFVAVPVRAFSALAGDADKAEHAKAHRIAAPVVLLVDRSRSALEATDLQARVIRDLVSALPPDTPVTAVAFDIRCTERTGGASPASEQTAEAIIEWLNAVEPDGASDLGFALTCAHKTMLRLQHACDEQPTSCPGHIIALSDGVSTWGTTRLATLAQQVEQWPNSVRFHAIGVGNAVDASGLRALTASGRGQVIIPSDPHTSSQEVATFTRQLDTPTVGDVHVSAGRLQVQPAVLGARLPGTVDIVIVRVPRGAVLPTELHLQGRVGREDRATTIPIAQPTRAGGLVERFGAAHIAWLERTGAAAEDIVQASQRFGVLSRHTSLLVLESEEAYRQHGIERRRGPGASPGTVTGGDLESIDGGPSVSPDRIQPGDPEVRIPAPRTARRVTVHLPWGEQVSGRWCPAGENGTATWIARFLVDLSIPEGNYPLRIEVEHADGRIEWMQTVIKVDTTAPTVRVQLRPHRRLKGVHVVRAWQLDGRDARGVELRMPDGQVVPLTALRLGRFVARWSPAQPVTWPLTVEVHAIDRALNQRSGLLELPSPGARATLGDGRRRPTTLPTGTLRGPRVGMDITAIATAGEATIAGTLQDGLWWRVGATSWRRLQAAGARLDHRVNDIAVTRRGQGSGHRIWVATAHGACRLDVLTTVTRRGNAPLSSRCWHRADGLPSDEVHSVLPTADGRVVFGTGEGIAILDKAGRLKPLGRKQGLPARAVWDLTQTLDGALWVASSWGLYRVTDEGVQRASVATAHLRDDWVTALATDGERVWSGTYKGGVTQLVSEADGIEATHLGGGHVNLRGLHVGAGHLWAATMEGLMAVPLDEGARGGMRPRGPARNRTAITVHGAGELLVGTRDGVTSQAGPVARKSRR